MLYITLPRTSHLVEEVFWNGRGVPLRSSLGSIVPKRSWNASLRILLLLNHLGISVRRYPRFEGSFSNAFCMHRAREWQMHLFSWQLGDSALTLDHTESYSPIIADAPSLPKPMQFDISRSNSVNFALRCAKSSLPFAPTTGRRPT